MGTLHSGTNPFELDDRLLAAADHRHQAPPWRELLHDLARTHLRWRRTPARDLDRQWVHIHVEYAGGINIDINRAWAESLADAASRGGGLFIHAEDVPLPT